MFDLTLRTQIHTLTDGSKVADVILKSNEDPAAIRFKAETLSGAEKFMTDLRNLIEEQTIETININWE